MRKIKFILLFLALSIGLKAATPELQRVEPMFWWAGMKNPALQLIVFGKNISETDVGLDYPGIELVSVAKVQNPDFLFIDLNILPEAEPGRFDILFQEKGKTVQSYSYELKQREKGSPNRLGFNSSDVIYLITPDRFANGDPTNDDIEGMAEKPNRNDPSGRHGGDLRGIINHLDYIKNMGFTAVWINPLLENNMPRTSYHGYAITDYYKTDPRYGSNEEYLELAKALKAKGIKLIMDMVFNHCGSEHWWMKNMPMPGWINHFPDYIITNHRRTVNQDPHASEADKRVMSEGWFVPSMPDLNQRNPYVENYLIQNSIWWIEYAGLNGIRQDTWPYSDKEMMSRWTARLREEYPDFNIVGEEWSLNPAIVSYWQKGKANPDGYICNLPSLMDFPLQNAVSKGLSEPENWDNGLIKIYETLANDFLYPDAGNLTIFPDNHDMPRFFTQVGEDVGLFKLGLAFFLTTRGIPQIFYGTEVLMSSPGERNDGIIRSDFPGGWPGDPANAFTGDGLSPEQKDVQDYLKTLLNWRKNQEVIHSGKLIHFAPEGGIYTYFRQNSAKTVMVVLNKNSVEKQLDCNRFKEITGKFTKGKEIISSSEINNLHEIVVPPKTAMIIELK